MKENDYWKELNKLGIHYGVGVRRHDHVVCGVTVKTTLEYCGQQFDSAKAIYDSVQARFAKANKEKFGK